MRPIGIALGVVAALAGSQLQAGEPLSDAAHWIADAAGCTTYNPHPVPEESITWSGGCTDGKVTGTGELQWSRDGKPTDRYTGEMSEGRPVGVGTYYYKNGDRYEGEFWQGRFDGAGTYIFANGARYVGDFVEGSSTRGGTLTLTDGRTFKTDLVTGRAYIANPKRYPAEALFVVCFTPSDSLESLTLVRGTGFTNYDEEAKFLLMRRMGGASWEEGKRGLDVASPPLPGCHMVGIAFGTGEYGVAFNDDPSAR